MKHTNWAIKVNLASLAFGFFLFASLPIPAQTFEFDPTSKQDELHNRPLADTLQTGVSPGRTGSWKDAFDRICAQTEIATTLSTEQLRQLIKDSDELLHQLGSIKDPWAKVYIFRLKKCKQFFNFALEWKAMEQQEETN